MQTMTININEKFTLPNLDTALSLRPFINFLKKSLKNDGSLKDKLTAFLLEKLAEFPELEGDVPLENLDKYRDVLELIFVSMSNVTEDENRLPWAMGLPMRPLFIYGTTAFNTLILLEFGTWTACWPPTSPIRPMSAGAWRPWRKARPGRALLLAEEEGLALAGLVNEVLGALPGLRLARAYQVADTLGRGENAFSNFMDLLRAALPPRCAMWCAGGAMKSSRDWLRCAPRCMGRRVARADAAAGRDGAVQPGQPGCGRRLGILGRFPP